MVDRTAFEMIRLPISQIPIGLTPGHLSRALSWRAIRAERPFRSMKVPQSSG